MSSDELIPIREIFGPTIQGEGLHVGRLATFVRVAGCDSYCEWCDTKYAWDVNDTRVTRMTADQIAESIIRKVSLHRLVVLTGGNPCLYDLGELIDILHNNDYEVHVETQGTKFPKWLRNADFISLSPKISMPGASFLRIAEAKSEVRNMIKSLDDIPHQLKFVIGDIVEYTLALEVAKSNPEEIVIFQPKYYEEKSVSRNMNGLTELANEICKDHQIPPNVRFMPQLHRIIWGDARGV